MNIERITTPEQLASLQTGWNPLAGGIPFRQWEWLTAWWSHFAERRELYVLRVTDANGELIGIAPWYVEQTALSGRVVQSLGSGIACTDYAGVLVDPRREREVVSGLADWLVQANGAGSADCWDSLHFDGMSAGDGTTQALWSDLAKRGCTLHHQAGASCWRIPLPATWDRYLQQLPKPQRKRMRQARQTLEQDDRFRILVAEQDEGWKPAWERFVELHQRRRMSLGQPGCFADTEFGSFLTTASEAFLRRGQTRLIVIEKEGEPAAALLAFLGDRVSYAYQMGTNPDLLADSPGWLVVCAAVLRGIERGENGLDFLRGDEPYKKRMGGVAHDMLEVRVVPDQLAAQLRHTAWRTGLRLKRWIKTGLQVTGIAAGHPSIAAAP